MTIYGYSPITRSLPEPRIRLLRIYGGISPEIRGELIDASLDDKYLMSYEAISYTWGRKNRLGVDGWRIQIGDRFIPITENAYRVLDHMRHLKTERIVWIDSVCINQGDKAERSHQVRQMAQIYTNAERVHVWLGFPSKDYTPIMEFLSQLQATIEKAKVPQTDGEYAQRWSTLQACPEQLERLKDSLAHILSLPWFRRVWILQEVGNAKRTQVHFGLSCVPGNLFAFAPQLVELEPDPHCQAVLDLMKKPEGRPSWWSNNRDLYALMKRFGASEAVEDRDHIYGLLGMCTDPGLEVDYSTEKARVISQTIAHIYQLPLELASRITPRYGTVKSFRSQIHSVGNLLLRVLFASRPIHTDMVTGLIRQGRDISVTLSMCLEILGKAHYSSGQRDRREALVSLLQDEAAAKEKIPKVLIDALVKTSDNKEVLKWLLQYFNTDIQSNEAILSILGQYATPPMMAWTLSKLGAASEITEKVLETAVKYATPETVAFILSKPGTASHITEWVLQTAVEYAKPETVALVLSKPGAASRITETVLCVAADHSYITGFIEDHDTRLESMRVLFREHEAVEKISCDVACCLIRGLGPTWPVIFPFGHEGARQVVKEVNTNGGSGNTCRRFCGNSTKVPLYLPFREGLDEMSLAAVCGDRRRVQNLVDMGHDINARDEYGWTALRYATEMGHYDLISWLKLHGAVRLKDEYGMRDVRG